MLKISDASKFSLISTGTPVKLKAMGHPKIAAIVLQFGNWQKTAECIESLLKSTLAPAWIIAVDNASLDDSCERLEQWLTDQAGTDLCIFADTKEGEPTQISLIKREKNGGYAAGNNSGIRLGLQWGADAFLIINNDAWLEQDALAAMWKRLSESPRAGLCGPLILYPTPDNLVQCCAGGHTNYMTGLSRFSGANLNRKQAAALKREDVERKLNFICGACTLASREFVERTGLLDEGYFLYCEEQDWALRAKNRFDLVYAPDALAYHHEGANTGWNRYAFKWRPSFRLMASRLRLAWRHHPHYLPTVALACGFAAGRILAKRVAAKLFTPKTNGT